MIGPSFEIGNTIAYSDGGTVKRGVIVGTTPTYVDVQVSADETVRTKKNNVLRDAPNQKRWEVGVKVSFPESSFIIRTDQVLADTEGEARSQAESTGWKVFPRAVSIEAWGCACVEVPFELA